MCPAARSGAAFAAAHYAVWSYNARIELTGSEQFLGTPESPGSPLPAGDRLYNYDPIGNRLDSTSGENDPLDYCPHELNQYDSIDDTTDCPPQTPISETFAYDADANLIEDSGGGGLPGWRYVWDAENRLIAAEALDPKGTAGGSLKSREK